MRTIAARLLMAFLCVILFLVAQGVVSHVITTNITRVQRDALSRELHLEGLQERLARTRLTAFKVLGTMNPYDMDRLRKSFDRDMDALTREIVAEGVDPGLAEQNAALYREIIGLHYDFSVKTARRLIDGHSEEVHEAVVKRLEDRRRELARATETRVREAHKKAHWISFALLLSALTVAGIWAYVLRHTLTDRRKAEERLQESEKRYRRAVEYSFDGIAIHRNGCIVFINRTGAELLGATDPESLLGRNLLDFIHPEYRDVVIDRVRDIESRRKPARLIEEKLLRVDGTKLDAEVTGIHVVFENEPAVQVVFRDITARKDSERALRESESRFRTLFDLSPQAIALTDVETGRLLDTNDRFCELTGYDKQDVVGRTTTSLFYSAEEREGFVREIKARGEVLGLEMTFRAKDGETLQTLMFSRTVHLSRGPVILTIFLDVTQQKRLEAQLQQAQRLESIGTLAGGIAHDFNNLLMGIQGRTSLMLAELDPSDPHVDHLKSIEEHVKSASELTGQILGFARGGKYEVKPTDLNALVRRSTEMFGRTRKDLRIQTEEREDLWNAEVDRRQIEQVLFNLFVNASHAMPNGGEIRIHTDNVIVKDDEARLHQVAPGPYACIRVADTGVGMDPTTLRRIFDPFFTTKELGRGTGLGLASAYGIVKNHNGVIDVTSRPGKGSVFRILLPATNRDAHEEPVPNRRIIKGSGTVLLVDDEEVIIDVGARMIEKLGYGVLIARNGKEALEILQKNRGRIDLVVLDMVMPDMSGGETFDRLREIDADVPVLLSSGYSINGQAKEILARGCSGFLQKPFDLHELSARIQEILDRT